MEPDVILAFDIGTGGCKAVILQRDGKVLAEAFCEYSATAGERGVVQQPTDDWWRAVSTCCAEVCLLLLTLLTAPSRT